VSVIDRHVVSVPYVVVQEKKGAEQQKPEEKEAQRREYEVAKMEKLLAMVRNVEKEK
jgi:hypothetical protein